MPLCDPSLMPMAPMRAATVRERLPAREQHHAVKVLVDSAYQNAFILIRTHQPGHARALQHHPIHAVTRLQPQEIRALKLLPAASSLTCSCHSGASAGNMLGAPLSW